MKQFSYVLTKPHALHAKPIGKLQREAARFVSQVRLSLEVTEPADVHLIANVEKKVPREWINEDGTYVSAELIHYIRPLIQAEIAPLWVDGLPRHLRLEK